MAVSMTGISIPNFVMAPLLVLVFAIYLRWLPAGGFGDGSVRNLVLPVTALALPQIAYLARLTRGSMIEVLRSNFVRTARAQGLPTWQVVVRARVEARAAARRVVPRARDGGRHHGLRRHRADLQHARGSAAIFVTGALNRDYTLVMGVVVFYGVLIIAFNFLVDLAYAWLDPKVQVPMSAAAAALDAQVAGRSLWADAWAKLKRNRAAVVSAWIIGAMAVLVIVGPYFSRYAFDFTDFANTSIGPSWSTGHFFGTDTLGRDLFVRTLYGGRISLLVGIVATAVSLLIGVTYGAVAGYFGGRVDALMMRIVDILYALPFMFFVILLMVFFGRNIVLIFVAIGAINWLDMARIVRGQTLTLEAPRVRRGGAGARRRRLPRSSAATSCRTCSASWPSTSR